MRLPGGSLGIVYQLLAWEAKRGSPDFSVESFAARLDISEASLREILETLQEIGLVALLPAALAERDLVIVRDPLAPHLADVLAATVRGTDWGGPVPDPDFVDAVVRAVARLPNVIAIAV